MDDIDLDSFIANIEQTAPEDNLISKLTCEECNVQLEEGEDGNYVCPNCSAQATGILQLDETELHHDDQGRPVYGQRVRTAETIRKHRVDYGWAWSTDDAVAHILALQIDALERTKLLPEFFRPAITNMWLKFWVENIAPHIKDTYEEDELFPISSKNAVKLRDIEVLVKVRDKVMIPTNLMKQDRNGTIAYKMFGSRFQANRPDDEILLEDLNCACKSMDEDSSSSSSSLFSDVDQQSFKAQYNEERIPLATGDARASEYDQENLIQDAGDVELNDGDQPGERLQRTRNLSDDSIAILTLNRTLAFIEATARCMNQNDPLFAADIIRGCNQRLIPFYGASKLLPAGMNLNSLDKLMFQKTRPPTPVQLTRTASLLIHKIYQDQLPKTLPTPDLSTILERFIKDLNLPYELHDLIKDEYTFFDFPATRPIVFTSNVKKRLPQYDRWAFAVLLSQLKKLFNLNDKYITLQGERAQMESRDKNEIYFDLNSWVQQLSLRLKLIFRYDPFVLYHPMAEVEKLECTPQMSKYINLIMDDRAVSTIRSHPNVPKFDETYRTELSEFINRQMTLPDGANKSILSDEELDMSSNIKMPLTDSYERTQKFWTPEIEEDRELYELVHRSFTAAKLMIPDSLPMWCIYDSGLNLTRWKLEISPDWPYAFRLLLHAGAFLCFCDPIELMNEVRLVEECFIPQAKIIKRMNAAKSRR